MASKKQQKLELTWIGKGKEAPLEPRILVENKEYSFGNTNTENLLIHGDNLLALKALEQDYAGKIKCIYIDPPFNTGAAFDNYDDGVEHSIWLDLMNQRIAILKNLLSNDGSIFVHLDDNEVDYCKILLDNNFGRNNFVNRISIDARSPSAFSTVNPGVFKSSEYILWFVKDKKSWESRSMRVPSKRDTAYNKFILNRNLDTDKWKFIPLKMAFLEYINNDKLQTIAKSIEDIFSKKEKLKTKNDLLNYLEINFSFDQLVNLKKLSTYLLTKLKTENNSEDFKNKVYPYLLEKVSFNFKEKDVDKFVYDNAESVYRETEISDSGAGKDTVELKYRSKKNPDEVLIQKREGSYDDIYVVNGKQISFYSKNVFDINGVNTATKLLTNIWTDISWEGIAKEGGVTFKKGKKPERLIERCLQLTTNKNDFVLDSFLGSGTTAAVAHKMNRKWIGIEFGKQAYTHDYKRLKAIVSGTDNSGITPSVEWQGGGGFKFYELAPSLLNKDKYNNWVISKKYNPAMLAAAMAKQEGFSYAPNKETYWKQGYSAEQDFIFTTTQFVTVELLDQLQDQLLEGESLLICAKKFQPECNNKFKNIVLKKIPKMLLGKCEFGKDDYSLNIINPPVLTEEELGDE
ncbi:site-specific DNA-methyltransferase [Tenacibaculum aquimarinum]|uniref:site-specific DNA-methyltransferase n=1 Tax=Tenacibaculum aquimarinum TaxID=2910675 RepID=UPI001F0ADA0B|nr:site-specific DNA-methyltransferase [Tenacibaculum aquimarinum]MCH3885678.1 site-specific DNA-methyltransferase [Tenacibaculum aquimarinum]